MIKRPGAILPPYLPMPYTARRPEGEYDEYRERRALQLREDPHYDDYWQGPSIQHAEAVWTLVTAALPLDIDDFLSIHSRNEDEIAELRRRAKQALVVAIDAAIYAAKMNRLLTANEVCDALAAKWSDWYRWARKETPARSVRDMSAVVATDLVGRPTYRQAWVTRDLLMNGLNLETFVHVVQAGVPGLYTTERVRTDTRDPSEVNEDGSVRRYNLNELIDSQIIAPLKSVKPLRQAPAWKRQGPRWSYQVTLAHSGSPLISRYRAIRGDTLGHRRILLASDPDPRRRDEYEVAAERKFDRVEPGPEGVATLQRLEAMRLNFHTDKFAADLGRLEQEVGAIRDPKRHKDAERKLGLSGLRAVADDIEVLRLAGKIPDDGVIVIRSRFFMTKNRRWEPNHFWVPEVTGSKDDRSEVWSVRNGVFVRVSNSRRLRWFSVVGDDGLRYDLVGVDVSSSQLQNLAILTGDIQLERLCQGKTVSGDQSFWTQAANLARRMDEDSSTKFSFPDPVTAQDPRRVKESLKHTVMTHIYGQGFDKIIKDLDDDLHGEYVSLGDRANLESLVFDPRLHLNVLFGVFRPMMQHIAALSYDKDPYTGVTLTDLIDGTRYRRNPWEPRDQRVAGTGVKIYGNVPEGPPNDAGDFKVNKIKLLTSIGPCFTHSLDGLYASIVIRQLSELGIPCVSIHDSWLVGRPHMDRLLAVLPHDDLSILSTGGRTVGAVWMQMLGPAYDDLERLLTDDREPALRWRYERKKGQDQLRPEKTRLNLMKKTDDYRATVRAWRETWRRRVEDQKWPRLRFGMVGPVLSYESDGVKIGEETLV